MGRTWIVLGHRTGVRILESRGPGSDLATVRETPFPWAHLQGKDFVTDRPGRKPHPGMPGRRAAMVREDPLEHYVELFAKQVADALEKDRVSGNFDRLVLVSEPRFLGTLRERLGDQTKRMVAATLAKDLAEHEPAQIRRSLQNTILV